MVVICSKLLEILLQLADIVVVTVASVRSRILEISDKGLCLSIVKSLLIERHVRTTLSTQY